MTQTRLVQCAVQCVEGSTMMFEDDFNQLTAKVALEENCGLMRMWELDGKKYFDCGPVTFIEIL